MPFNTLLLLTILRLPTALSNLPKRRRSRRSSRLKIFIKPRPNHASRAAHSTDLDTLTAPPFFSASWTVSNTHVEEQVIRNRGLTRRTH
jgi:hypothetical protein